MKVRKFVVRAATVAMATGALIGGTATAASASGFLTACYPVHAGNWGGGWCDGNGPDWTYRPAVLCNNMSGVWIVSRTSHWAGDRGSIYQNCPTGGSSIHGGLAVYDLGTFEGIFSD
jgi:hypothetical protein